MAKYQEFRFWSALIETEAVLNQLLADGWRITGEMLTGYTLERNREEVQVNG